MEIDRPRHLSTIRNFHTFLNISYFLSFTDVTDSMTIDQGRWVLVVLYTTKNKICKLDITIIFILLQLFWCVWKFRWKYQTSLGWWRYNHNQCQHFNNLIIILIIDYQDHHFSGRFWPSSCWEEKSEWALPRQQSRPQSPRLFCWKQTRASRWINWR